MTPNLKKTLAVVIPTKNRPKAIDQWLYQTASKFKEKNVDLIIYDSSDDENTEAVVYNFQIEGHNNIKYEKYFPQSEEKTLDNKVITAYSKYSDEYEFIWVCRDGLIIDLEKALNTFEKDLNSNTDLIVVNAEWRNIYNLKNCTYVNPTELFRDQCQQMTILGSTIIRSKIIKEIIKTIPLEKGITLGLWQPIAFFKYFHDKKISAKYYTANIWTYNQSAPQSSFWHKDTIEQWCEIWYNLINNLPIEYNPYKNKVMHVKMYDFEPLSFNNIIDIKLSGNLSVKTVQKYSEYIKQVSNVKLKNYYLISLCPNFILKILKKQRMKKKGIIKNIHMIIRGVEPGDENAEG